MHTAVVVIATPVLAAIAILLAVVAFHSLVFAGRAMLLGLLFIFDVLLAVERSVAGSSIVCRIERFIAPKVFARCLTVCTLSMWFTCCLMWIGRPRRLSDYVCLLLLSPLFVTAFCVLLDVASDIRSPSSDASAPEPAAAPKRPARSARHAAD